MIITDYIFKNVSPLYEEDTVEKAEDIMLTYKLSHLPVISEKKKLLGNISFEIIKNLEKKEVIINHLIELEEFFLYQSSIIFDSIKIFSDNATNIIPIIDTKENYLGVVLEEDIIEEFATYAVINDFGVYMTLTTPIQKYSISEVANIVESNNGKILGLMVTKIDEETTKITLKIQSENISSIGDTFERFGYHISNKYFEDSKQELLKNRFDHFQRFLEV
ncbi:CBS domain-containing protein [Apibacter adventoris]|uniref:CBS domain-containing protein n=1 Tax=Apibacter adventoris TaxID=1679466 RepID=UPI000CF72FA5|nr:CBS domain-containing protein [Apibacter adventoris]PQL93634.1 acetoin utilization protein [Apibacter adventoris]